MLTEEDQVALLERAKAEEEVYNWIEAAKLYEQVAKSFMDKEMVKKAAETYKMLGYASERAAETVDTAKDYLEQNQYAANAYRNAANLFKQIGTDSDELECEAEIFYINGLVTGSVIEAKKMFSQSYELFIKSSDFFSKNDDRESLARTLSKAAMASFYLMTYCSDKREIKQVYQKGRDIANEAWKLSKEVGNIQSLAESLFAEGMLSFGVLGIIPFKWNERWREYTKKLLLKCEESLKLAEDSDDSLILGMIYFVAGNWYCHFGIQFIDDEKEQKEYIDNGLMLSEKALVFAKKVKIKSLIIISIWMMDYHAFTGARFKYVQKRILNDIREILKIGKIYAGSYNIWHFFANFLPSLYYTNIAQRSFFTPAQRKTFAENGIEYAEESLKKLSFLPVSAWAYQMLTWSHSQLAILEISKNERDEHAQKMLQYAKEAKNIAEKYEGGFAPAAGYSSLYRAYKTLADIAENEENRIKMLSAAIDAHNKYMEHPIESRTGIMAAQMRLSLLYEELGIITKETNPLMRAKKSFIHMLKEGSERGYHFCAAAAHESNARIEDRLGNHTASAENYEKAQKAHEESLKKIEYKSLKDLVKEKIEYNRAWNQIEKAKVHHKRENHLKAKENYEKASKILEKVLRYKYEVPYYTAWALLEEAEQFSKQDRQDDAIERYEATRISFEDSIKTLEKAIKRSKVKKEREQIEKLEKVAKIRINYCTARINLEKARILGKQGKHIAAAENFASAASQFRDICTFFKIERERRELEAIYYLCRAWESMELAEKYENPDRFAEASGLFIKASNLFTDSKLKLLASGNSAFCQALEYGCKFDESIETEVKAQLYQQVKAMLRKAESSYDKGGFESVADWALATSTYFDATWHIIRADETLELDEREKLLRIGSKYLKSAAELFSKAGYKDKEMEILKRLNRLEKEEKILVSALNTIQEPSISRSTMGIVAPSCPIEIGHSTRLSEIREITEEERRVSLERGTKKKYQIVYMDLIEKYPRIQKRECRVAIAQIGVSKTDDILSEFYEMKASGLLGLREDKVEMVKSKVKSLIENANENGVNILLFPEMTVDFNYSEFLEEISDLAKLYEMYIIPGSYHDQETQRNLSMVIGPDGILWEQSKHIPAIIHLGRKRLKEAIEVGTMPRKTIVCNTEFGRIAVIICRDFLDMDLRVELKNFEPPVDIILNPAFTPVTADFKAAHFDARRSIYAYCFFANVGEFGDSLIYTPEKERVERNIPPKEEGLIYKDIDLFKLRSERKKWEKEKKKERLFIQSTR